MDTYRVMYTCVGESRGVSIGNHINTDISVPHVWSHLDRLGSDGQVMLL